MIRWAKAGRGEQAATKQAKAEGQPTASEGVNWVAAEAEQLAAFL